MSGHVAPRVSRLVVVAGLAAAWLVVLAAQLPAHESPDVLRRSMALLGGARAHAVHFSGFGAAYPARRGGVGAEMGRRVAIRRFEAHVDYDASTADVRVPDGAAAAEDLAHLRDPWVTPHGLFRAITTMPASVRRVPLGTEVRFSVRGRQYVGLVNDRYLVDRVQTWVDEGAGRESMVEFVYRDYEPRGRAQFPRHITQYHDGVVALDLWVANARAEYNTPRLRLGAGVGGGAGIGHDTGGETAR